MTKLIPIISQQEIAKKVQETGKKISRDYRDKSLTIVGILKGAVIFLADLTRNISIDHKIDFAGVSSYKGSASTGQIKLTKHPDLEMSSRDILIVEDIVDTGRTLDAMVQYFKTLNPASVKICALIDKQERRSVEIDVAYSCFFIEKGFIVGYGLDYNENYRHLPAIYNLEF
ncbi:MAG: hypoxanthine phosphoribosyltransferase [Thermodesulfobacteriota bacterium]|nr:hypoxanthine phosphoribosyltransferase [Thermodesulfobacteriota bacterium]